MKKSLELIICLLLTVLVVFNLEPITDYITSFFNEEKRVYVASSNEYKKDYEFKFIKMSKEYVPYSYEALLNIIYSTLNNGWKTFTFYCPDEYTDCLEDITKISNDITLLSNINNFTHPFNNFEKIGVITSTTGEVTINITKLYSDEDINKINIKVDEIITKELTNEMSNEDKILKIHDYIINNTKYDTESKSKNAYDANGPLFDGLAVCSGYADLMAIFLTKLNIPNFKVASETHVWNAIYINKEWLHIDLTWDDPVTKDSNADTLLHQFFLVNTDKLLEFDTKDHTFDTTIYQELK